MKAFYYLRLRRPTSNSANQTWSCNHLHLTLSGRCPKLQEFFIPRHSDGAFLGFLSLEIGKYSRRCSDHRSLSYPGLFAFSLPYMQSGQLCLRYRVQLALIIGRRVTVTAAASFCFLRQSHCSTGCSPTHAPQPPHRFYFTSLHSTPASQDHHRPVSRQQS